jgi:hypothetical protein
VKSKITMTQPKLLDTVAILSPLPYDRLIQVEPDKLTIDTLPIGLIGTVVETYDKPETYLIEFSDTEGCEYAMAILPANELLVVHLDLTPSNLDLVAA